MPARRDAMDRARQVLPFSYPDHQDPTGIAVKAFQTTA